MRIHGIRKGLCLSLLAALPLTGLAAGSATLGTGQATSRILWQDSDTLRMQQGSNDGDYFLVRDGTAYSVTNRGGKPMVIDMGAMLQMMRGAAGSQDAQPNLPQPGSFEATGDRETVAGIPGQVYRMQWTDGQGQQHKQEVVLTDDPRVVEMTRAYLGSIGAMFGGESASGFQQAMPADARGLLRVGQDFRLVEISDAQPAESEFELPAEPTSLQDMMRGRR